VRCFCSVRFDIDRGQVLEECYPAEEVQRLRADAPTPWAETLFFSFCGSGISRLSVLSRCGGSGGTRCITVPPLPPFSQLSKDEAHKIACLALPEATSGQLGDTVFTFRIRTWVLPLPSALERGNAASQPS
jgi:hypothetical protein